MNIYEYSDYRIFVSDRLEELKKEIKNFSIRKELKATGVTNPSFLLYVTKYKKNINALSARKLAQFLKLPKQDRDYFLKLVNFNQEENLQKKRELAKGLLRHSNIKKMAPLVAEKYEYFSHWINITLFELLASRMAVDSVDELHKKFRGLATKPEISQALNLLKRLGLIEEKSGFLVQTQKVILSDDEISSTFAASHYEAFLKVAIQSMENDPLEVREFTSLTFSLSPKKIREIKNLVLEFRNELIEAVSGQDVGEDVFQVMLQFYPITRS